MAEAQSGDEGGHRRQEKESSGRKCLGGWLTKKKKAASGRRSSGGLKAKQKKATEVTAPPFQAPRPIAIPGPPPNSFPYLHHTRFLVPPTFPSPLVPLTGHFGIPSMPLGVPPVQNLLTPPVPPAPTVSPLAVAAVPNLLVPHLATQVPTAWPLAVPPVLNLLAPPLAVPVPTAWPLAVSNLLAPLAPAPTAWPLAVPTVPNLLAPPIPAPTAWPVAVPTVSNRITPVPTAWPLAPESWVANWLIQTEKDLIATPDPGESTHSSTDSETINQRKAMERQRCKRMKRPELKKMPPR